MFTFDPAIAAALLLICVLYVRAVAILRRRGRSTPRLQQAAWFGGIALMAIALMGPTGSLSEKLMVGHMAEHLLIAELAAPLLLVGIRSPVLLFILPRPALVTLARNRGLRRFWRKLRRPAVAIAVYAIVLYFWHFDFAFVAALRDPLVHGLQHQSFIVISILVWWPALQPERARMPGELWKIGHIFAARLVSVFLGMAMIFGGHPFYADYYGDRARAYGLTPLADQQAAGGLMMTLDTLIIMFALSLFFLRSAQDHDRAEAARSSANRVSLTS